MLCMTAAEEMAALVADFPEYDEELLKLMLEDQVGDVLETRAVLRVSLPLYRLLNLLILPQEHDVIFSSAVMAFLSLPVELDQWLLDHCMQVPDVMQTGNNCASVPTCF